MKKFYFFVLILCFALSLSGCTATDGNENTETPTPSLPNGAVLALYGDEIELGDITIRLPDGMTYGQEKTENGTVYYVWRTGADYVAAKNLDVVFYIYAGEDINSPDKILTDAEARNSISQSYMQIFRTAVDDGRINVDANITSTDDWYTLCFTGYSGSDNVVTTYGVYCYPKTYYGVYMLQKNITNNYSRHYYGFVFSNDAIGSMLTQREYESLLEQIKGDFLIDTFYTLPQNELSYDPTKDFSNGYSYTQLETLFQNTTNYYIIKGDREEDTTEGDTKSGTLSELYNVVRVVDGDTIIVSIDGEDVTVRLIGVDTPESVHTDDSKNTAEGKEASDWTSALLTDANVYLEYDVDTEDDFGRTLAYVYIDDIDGGLVMVNRLLLENGLAQIMTIQPNSKYASEFYQLQVAAREAKKGFWETGFFK